MAPGPGGSDGRFTFMGIDIGVVKDMTMTVTIPSTLSPAQIEAFSIAADAAIERADAAARRGKPEKPKAAMPADALDVLFGIKTAADAGEQIGPEQWAAWDKAIAGTQPIMPLPPSKIIDDEFAKFHRKMLNYNSLVAGGFLTADEIRRLEDLPPPTESKNFP